MTSRVVVVGMENVVHLVHEEQAAEGAPLRSIVRSKIIYEKAWRYSYSSSSVRATVISKGIASLRSPSRQWGMCSNVTKFSIAEQGCLPP